MTSTAGKSQGATIGLGDAASPELFPVIVNITSMSGPTLEAPDIDVTDLSSTAKEYIQGLEDPSSVEIRGFYDGANATHTTMRDNVGANVSKNYLITLPTSPNQTIAFAARVSAWSLDIAVDGAVEVSMTLKLSGSVVFA